MATTATMNTMAATAATATGVPVGHVDDADRRGPNRVNEHTLDMRSDRVPDPTTHYHAPVPCGRGRQVNHSETAIGLRRATYLDR